MALTKQNENILHKITLIEASVKITLFVLVSISINQGGKANTRWSYLIPSKFDTAHHNQNFKPKRSGKNSETDTEFLAFLKFG